MATNYMLIELAAQEIGFEYDGGNLKTFQEWKKAGYSVMKGQTAFMKVDLWTPFMHKVTDKQGKPVIDPKTGKQEEETRFKLKAASLFTFEQVEKLKAAAPKKKTTRKKSA